MKKIDERTTRSINILWRAGRGRTAGDGYKICGNGVIGVISVPVQPSIANFETL